MFVITKMEEVYQDERGLLVYFRTGIPSRKLKTNLPGNVEGIFFDMNIRNKKWLIIAAYIPNKEPMSCREVSNRKIRKSNNNWRFQFPNGRICHERLLLNLQLEKPNN